MITRWGVRILKAALFCFVAYRFYLETGPFTVLVTLGLCFIFFGKTAFLEGGIDALIKIVHKLLKEGEQGIGREENI